MSVYNLILDLKYDLCLRDDESSVVAKSLSGTTVHGAMSVLVTSQSKNTGRATEEFS